MIEQFIAQVKSKGLARTNRYNVQIPFPNTDGDGSQLVSLFCESFTLPGMNISTTPSRIFGESREMPYERIFDPITFEFYVDSGMEVKAAFERWIHLIVNQGTRTVQYYEKYVRDIDIYVKNVEENSVYYMTLYEAYPKSIQSIAMSAGSKEAMKLSVNMQYRYWTTSASVNTR